MILSKYLGATGLTMERESLGYIPRTPQNFPWARTGHLSFIDDCHAVDQNIFHPFRQLIRLVEGCPIMHRSRIENHNVSPHSGLEHAAVCQTHALCRQG